MARQKQPDLRAAQGRLASRSPGEGRADECLLNGLHLGVYGHWPHRRAERSRGEGWMYDYRFVEAIR